MKRILSAFLVAGSLASPLASANARADEAADIGIKVMDSLIETENYLKASHTAASIQFKLDSNNDTLLALCADAERGFSQNLTGDWAEARKNACRIAPLRMGILGARANIGYFYEPQWPLSATSRP